MEVLGNDGKKRIGVLLQRLEIHTLSPQHSPITQILSMSLGRWLRQAAELIREGIAR